jgi:signal transduction histidine kinase
VTAGRADAEVRQLRRTAARLGLQTAAAVAAIVALLTAVAVRVVLSSQHAAADALLVTTVERADSDVSDPPAGVWLTIQDGQRLQSTAGLPAGLPDRAALAAVARTGVLQDGDVLRGGIRYHVRTQRRGATTVQAVLDLKSNHVERDRLVAALLASGGLGLVLAGSLGGWLGRRTVRPLAAALALQRRFVADASHELRTPLTLLSTRAQLLRRRLAEAGSGAQPGAGQSGPEQSGAGQSGAGQPGAGQPGGGQPGGGQPAGGDEPGGGQSGGGEESGGGQSDAGPAGAGQREGQPDGAGAIATAPAGPPVDVGLALDGVVADANRLAAILDDLLLAADPRADPPAGTVDLAALVAEVVAAAAPVAAESGVAVRGPAQPTAAPVTGSAAALGRALTALVDNAVRHARSTVTVVVEAGRRETAVEVCDDGPGVDPAALPRMFARFSPAPPPSGRRYGLGLALVGDTAARHGGRVSARNLPTGGAAVRLTLPTPPLRRP